MNPATTINTLGSVLSMNLKAMTAIVNDKRTLETFYNTIPTKDGDIKFVQKPQVEALEAYFRMFPIKYNMDASFLTHCGQEIDNRLYATLYSFFNKLYTLKGGRNVNESIFNSVMMSVHTSTSETPIKDYLNRCFGTHNPKGTSEIDLLFDALPIRENVDIDYLRQVFKIFLTGAVKQVFEHFKETDFANTLMPILISDKIGTGKTKFFSKLFGAGELINYRVTLFELEPKNNDFAALFCRNFGVIIDDMQAARKNSEADLRAFLSKTNFTYRRPYDRSPQSYNRIASVVGTTNYDNIISDAHHNRRLIAIPLRNETLNFKIMDSINFDKVWAEAVYLYRTGQPFELSQELMKATMQHSSEFETEYEIMNILRSHFLVPTKEQMKAKDYDKMTSTDIYNYLDANGWLPSDKSIKINYLGKILQKEFERISFRAENGNSLKGYAVIKKT